MNVVDSSGWISYLKNDAHAAKFSGPIEALNDLLVPTVTITEVFRFVARNYNRKTALGTVSYMRRGHVVSMDAQLAIEAATFGLKHKLPLADSIIYATVMKYDAKLWTQDSDFEGLPGVKFFL